MLGRLSLGAGQAILAWDKAYRHETRGMGCARAHDRDKVRKACVGYADGLT